MFKIGFASLEGCLIECWLVSAQLLHISSEIKVLYVIGVSFSLFLYLILPPVFRPSTFPSEPSALLLADIYYTRLGLCGYRDHLSEENLMELYSKLQSNISNNVSKVIILSSSFL